MSSKDHSEQAAQYLDNWSAEFNDISQKSKSAGKLLATAAGVIRKQREENQRLQQELAALREAAAQQDAAVEANLDTAKKLLSRTADIARTDKSGAVALRACVIDRMDTAVKLLERTATKPPAL